MSVYCAQTYRGLRADRLSIVGMSHVLFHWIFLKEKVSSQEMQNGNCGKHCPEEDTDISVRAKCIKMIYHPPEVTREEYITFKGSGVSLLL